jgi:hypothetical protein
MWRIFAWWSKRTKYMFWLERPHQTFFISRLGHIVHHPHNVSSRGVHDRQMHSCLGLLCRVSIIWSVCAREVSEDRLRCYCFYAGLSSSFPALHFLIAGIGFCNLFGSSDNWRAGPLQSTAYCSFSNVNSASSDHNGLINIASRTPRS